MGSWYETLGPRLLADYGLVRNRRSPVTGNHLSSGTELQEDSLSDL